MSLSRARVRYVLLPKEEASVTERGIAFRGMYYTCMEAEKEDWYSKARIAGRSKIEAAYDPASTAYIYLKHEDGRFLQCSRMDVEGREGDTTFAEAQADRQQDLDEQAAHTHKEMEKKAELGDFIDQEVLAAERLSEEQGKAKASKTQRIADIGKNRQEAVRAEKGLAGQENMPDVSAMARKDGETELNAVEKLIRKQLEEHLKNMGD